jgi:hypothetical protein
VVRIRDRFARAAAIAGLSAGAVGVVVGAAIGVGAPLATCAAAARMLHINVIRPSRYAGHAAPLAR